MFVSIYVIIYWFEKYEVCAGVFTFSSDLCYDIIDYLDPSMYINKLIKIDHKKREENYNIICCSTLHGHCFE